MGLEAQLQGRRVLFISYNGMLDPLGQTQVLPYLRELGKKGVQFTLLSLRDASNCSAARFVEPRFSNTAPRLFLADGEDGSAAAAASKCRCASAKLPARSASTPRYVCAAALFGLKASAC